VAFTQAAPRKSGKGDRPIEIIRLPTIPTNDHNGLVEPVADRPRLRR
jgi:hypothetical protein